MFAKIMKQPTDLVIYWDKHSMILPCKVGDKIYRCVYYRSKKLVSEWAIVEIEIFADEVLFIDDTDNAISISDIGKTVFLTSAEAEAAL